MLPAFNVTKWLDKAQASPRSLLGAGAGLLALLLALGGALPDLKLAAGEETGLLALLQETWNPDRHAPWGRGSGLDAAALPPFLLPLFWGALLLTALYAIVSPAYRKALLGAAATALLLTYVLYRLQTREEAPREVEAGRAGAMQGLGDGAPSREPPTPPAWVEADRAWWVWGLSAGIGGAAAWVLFGVWRRFGRRAEDPRAGIAQEAAGAMAALDAGHDMADTVMRCYVAMVQTFERTGQVRRTQAMTPREFESRLVRAGFHSASVRQLSQLFERVRFGDHPSTPRERAQARDCLQRIASAVTAPA